MATPNLRLEQRLDELEIKASFTEDLVDRLNEVIVRQQDQIDALIALKMEEIEKWEMAPHPIEFKMYYSI